MLCGWMLGVAIGLREIDIAIKDIHLARDVHGLVRTGEIDRQMPGLVPRRLPQQAQTLGCDPVVAIRLRRQRRCEGRRKGSNLSTFLEVCLMSAHATRCMQVRRVGIAWLVHAPADRVPLSGAIDSGREAPFRQQMLAFHSPAGFRLVQVKLAAPHHVIAGLAKKLVVSGLLERIVEAVVRHAAIVILDPCRKTCPRRRAQRRCTVAVVKPHSPGSDLVETRSANRDEGVQASPVIAQLVRHDEEKIRRPARNRSFVPSAAGDDSRGGRRQELPTIDVRHRLRV